MFNIQVEFWQLIGFMVAIVGAFIAGGWTLINIIVKQFTARLDEKFTAVEQLRSQREKVLDEKFQILDDYIKAEGVGWRKLERELLQLKADLPMQYVRREDAIRQEVVIHSKLDALAAKIDALRAGG